MHTWTNTQKTQHKYLQVPVNSVGSRDGSKYIVLPTADLLKVLLPVARNLHMEPVYFISTC